MVQEDYWKLKWKEIKNNVPNNFARRSFSCIANKEYKKLLDLGCGDGRDSVYFSRKGLKVTAVDFSESGIENLRKKVIENNLNIKTICSDIQNINFGNNSFDVIYAHLSLHYFDDKTTTDVFSRLYDILKPNGRIFIKCKSVEDYLFGKGEKVGENMYIKKHIRHFFDKSYMTDKLSMFKIIRVRKSSSKYYEYKSSFIEAIATK